MSNARAPQPLAAAWSWSRRRSPLLRLLHWLPHRLRPHARAAAFLRESDLPEPARAAIDGIVRRTRLWSDERLDLARELTAHARDALDAGRDPADTASSLGRPRAVAPLLRRAAKRKRHWFWHARRRILQSAGVAVLALLGVYAVLFVRFNTGSPSITHDYIADLNARNSTYEADQHAYPAISVLSIAWIRERMALMDDEQAAINTALEAGDEAPWTPWAYGQIPYADPDDPAYPRLLAAHERLRPLIDAAVAASGLPTLGVPYTDRYDETVTDDGLTLYHPLPPSEPSMRPDGLAGVLLPWLGRMKLAAKPVAFDAVVAARAGDAERAARSLTGAFNMARLAGREHTLIASLVGIAMQTMTEKVALGILHDHPDLFTQEQLAALAHTIAVSASRTHGLDLASEAMFFDDVLQRIYTDDGHGDGHITAEGLRFLNTMYDPGGASGQAVPTTNAFFTTPVIAPLYQVTMRSRKELKAVHQSLIDHARAMLDEGPTAFALPPADADPDPMHPDRTAFPILSVLTPSYESAIETAFRARAHTDATLVAIACHLHRARAGAFPTALDQLDRAVLPEIPPDPFDPGQPIKLRSDGSTLRIYFAGVDADDDNGTPPPDPGNRDLSSLGARYRTPERFADDPTADGDWVVYPPNR